MRSTYLRSLGAIIVITFGMTAITFGQSNGLPGNAQKPVEVLMDLSEQAGDTGAEMERMHQSIFEILDPTIQEVFDLAKFINQTEGQLDGKAHQQVLETVRGIYESFEALAQDKDKWKYELESTLKDVLDLLREGERHKNEYAKETEKMVQRFRQKKAEDVPELRQDMMQMGIDLSKKRERMFTDFYDQLGEYKNFNEDVRDNIEEFLDVIEESAITTAVMVDLLEVSAQRDVILKNLNGLQHLEEYMKNINESLQELGQALMKLQSITDDYTS